MANKYQFNRDSITVNGRTFPAQYAVMTGDCMSIEILVTVDGGENVCISIPPSDRQHAAALKAAQMGLTLDGGSGPEAVQAAADARQDRGQDMPTADGGNSPEAVQAAADARQDRGQDMPTADGGSGPEAVRAAVSAPVSPATAETAAAETVDNVAAAADGDSGQDMPAQDSGNRPEAVQTATATATATAAAPDAETINNKEVNTMNKSIKTAAEAVKAAAAAEVQEMTTAAEADPKATRGPVPEKTFINQVIAGNGWSIVFDAGCNRTRVIISDPVKAAARPIVEEAGFYYSKTLDSWNKKLTFRAHRAAEKLAEKLRAALA